MALPNLSDADKLLIGRCLDFIATQRSPGPDADHPTLFGWDFDTIMGMSVVEFLSVRERWPDVDHDDPLVRSAVVIGLVNLWGYPHGRKAEQPVSDTEIKRLIHLFA